MDNYEDEDYISVMTETDPTHHDDSDCDLDSIEVPPVVKFEDRAKYGKSILESLSPELLFQIFRHLDWQIILKIREVCQVFKEICTSQAIWNYVEALDFRYCSIPLPRNIAMVTERCPNTKSLYLGGVLISNDQRGPPVDNEETLSEFDTLILNILTHCPILQHINLGAYHTSDSTVDAIRENCPHLRSLAISDSAFIGNESILKLLRVKHLKGFSISRCRGIVNLCLADSNDQNVKLDEMCELRLAECDIATSNLARIIKMCPGLEILNITDNPMWGFDITPTLIDPALYLKCLKELELINCRGLQVLELNKCPMLEKVDVTGCYNLVKLELHNPKLKAVILQDCHIIQTISIRSKCLKTLNCDHKMQLRELECPPLEQASFLNCAMLPPNSLPAVKDTLDIHGCKLLGPDVVDNLLKQKDGILNKLTCLTYGGNNFETVKLNSATMEQMNIVDINQAASIELDIPSLRKLSISSCRDLEEHVLMDGLFYGKIVHKKKLANWLVVGDEEETEKQLQIGGVSNITCLKFERVPGLIGQIFSKRGIHFHSLSHLEVSKCSSLKRLELVKWPSLQSVQLSSCTHLKHFKVSDIPSLTLLKIEWCSLVKNFDVRADNLETLELNGSSFVRFVLESAKLEKLNIYGLFCDSQVKVDIRCCNLKALSLSRFEALTLDKLQQFQKHCPKLTQLELVVCQGLGYLHIPSNLEGLKMLALRKLTSINIPDDHCIKEVMLGNLPKFQPSARDVFLRSVADTLTSLHMGASQKESCLVLALPNLLDLSVDQGIHLVEARVNCPKLKHIRIQGCPILFKLELTVDDLAGLEVHHSIPLRALHELVLDTKKTKALAPVLEEYTPSIGNLVLTLKAVTLSLLHKLGSFLPRLNTITLKNCEHLDNYVQNMSPNSFVLSREKTDRTIHEDPVHVHFRK